LSSFFTAFFPRRPLRSRLASLIDGRAFAFTAAKLQLFFELRNSLCGFCLFLCCFGVFYAVVHGIHCNRETVKKDDKKEAL